MELEEEVANENEVIKNNAEIIDESTPAKQENKDEKNDAAIFKDFDEIASDKNDW